MAASVNPDFGTLLEVNATSWGEPKRLRFAMFDDKYDSVYIRVFSWDDRENRWWYIATFSHRALPDHWNGKELISAHGRFVIDPKDWELVRITADSVVLGL